MRLTRRQQKRIVALLCVILIGLAFWAGPIEGGRLWAMAVFFGSIGVILWAFVYLMPIDDPDTPAPLTRQRARQATGAVLFGAVVVAAVTLLLIQLPR